ncbi:hypothetical protein DBR22_22775 [Arthrobacter sp. HMWF013]|nr:hypothetical protein DBR22_22775 [Arthrobacter sp. HMWF013]
MAGSGGFAGFGAVPVPSRSQLSQAQVGALAAVGPPRVPPHRGPQIRPRHLIDQGTDGGTHLAHRSARQSVGCDASVPSGRLESVAAALPR